MEESSIQPIHILHPRPEPWRKCVQGRAVWLRPFVVTEWLCDWAAFWLSRWAFVAVLQHIGTLSILVGVIFYFTEAPDRLKQKHYQAWQVINTAQGKGGSGGRIEALTELNNDGEPLVGVDISKAFLEGIHLPHASMRRANMQEADLLGSDLSGADLEDGDLSSANLRNAKLEGVNLQDADLQDSDLTGAHLKRADLRDSNLEDADLSNADLQDIQWQGIDLKNANIYGVKNAPSGFVQAAMKMGAVSKVGEADTAPAK